MFLDQIPPTSEIKWLCLDVDGYKIVNVYKSLLKPLQSLDLPVFPHHCLYAGVCNCRYVDWGYDDNSADGECLAGWASIKDITFLYFAKDAPSFHSSCWNLAFARCSRIRDRRFLEKFLRSQNQPSLFHNTTPQFAFSGPSTPI